MFYRFWKADIALQLVKAFAVDAAVLRKICVHDVVNVESAQNVCELLSESIKCSLLPDFTSTGKTLEPLKLSSKWEVF